MTRSILMRGRESREMTLPGILLLLYYAITGRGWEGDLAVSISVLGGQNCRYFWQIIQLTYILYVFHLGMKLFAWSSNYGMPSC